MTDTAKVFGKAGSLAPVSHRSQTAGNETDFRNGNQSFPEIDLLMQRLLAYSPADYYAAENDFPKMVPLRKWVVPSPHFSVHIFPGGNGLQHGVAQLPTEYAMILMHDFDVLDRYNEAVDVGYSREQDVTATTLIPLLRSGGVDTSRCFYTNRFMGLRHAKDQYGQNPGRKYRPFLKLSDEMLSLTLDTIRPRVIFMIGRNVPDSLGLTRFWRNVYVGRARVCERDVVAASLTHTSFYHRNVITASYAGCVGHDAEIEVIKAAMLMADLA